MNKLLFVIVLFVLCMSAHSLKAMLYCYLPSVQDPSVNRSQYVELAKQVQAKLDSKNIDVQVSVCNQQEAKKLYDPRSINQLFTVDGYDILQVDVMNIQAITQELLEFTKEDLRQYYDQVFAFQWDPVRLVKSYGEVYIGSPGLMCSDFIQKRLKNDDLIDLMQSKLKSSFALVSLYTGFYLNTVDGSTIDTMDYQNVNPEVVQKIKQFLLQCQVNKQKFQPDNNFCWNSARKNFFKDNKYTTTTGYSQNLYNFFSKFEMTLNSEQVEVSHIMGKAKNKLVYLDEFIAKDSDDPQYKQTVYRFYKAMLEPDILDIYVKGTYTILPVQNTYLLPPTKKYFDEIRATDSLYNDYYQELFAEGTIHHPLFSAKFSQNLESLYTLIVNALTDSSSQQSHQMKVGHRHQLKSI